MRLERSAVSVCNFASLIVISKSRCIVQATLAQVHEWKHGSMDRMVFNRCGDLRLPYTDQLIYYLKPVLYCVQCV